MTRLAWLGVDVGTQSVRAIAVCDAGKILAEARAPLTSRREGDRHEQSPEQWWQAVITAVSATTSALADDVIVRALAVSATSGTVLLVDDAGEPVTEGLMYDDARGAPFTDRARAAAASLSARLGYRIQPSWALPKLLWLHDEGLSAPDRFFVQQADFINARLAGRPLPSDTSHTLKSVSDPFTADWPADVHRSLGLPSSLFPPIVESGTIIGRVSADSASLTGLSTDTMIVAGMTDGCAAQIAAGALAPGRWNSVIGTTLVVKGASTSLVGDPTGAVYAHRAPFGAGWFPGGASSTGAGAFSTWLPDFDLDRLTDIARGMQSFPLAYALSGRGERFPFVAPDAISFVEHEAGERRDLDNPDIGLAASVFGAFCHSIAFVERLSFELLELIGYDTSGGISFTGGTARNGWWNQLRCDVLGRTIMVPPVAEGAVGMAVLAAAALDEPHPERLADRAERMLPAAVTLTPDAPRSAALDERYVAFVRMLHARGWLPEELYAHVTKGRER